MRRSRLLVAALPNLIGATIVGWSFVTMSSMANIFGVAAVAVFGAAFLLRRHERRRAAGDKPTSA